jgi:hypothetical protein
MYHHHHRESRSERARTIAECTPIDDLLFKQRKGKFLNPQEKQRVQKYAEQRRKENLNKKKKV